MIMTRLCLVQWFDDYSLSGWIFETMDFITANQTKDILLEFPTRNTITILPYIPCIMGCIETVVCSRCIIWCATTIAGNDTILETRYDIEQTPQLILVKTRTTNDIQLVFVCVVGTIVSATATAARIYGCTNECIVFVGQWTCTATGVAQSTASIARAKWIR